MLVIVGLRWESLPLLQTMDLNEFGDFLAGVFGPLTLFWLILGYIQQQKELSQNTEALQQQALELKNTVEQHKELVKAAYEQIKLDTKALDLAQQKSKLAAQPNFSIQSARRIVTRGGVRDFEIVFENSGKPGTNLKIDLIPELNIKVTGNSDFSVNGQKHVLQFSVGLNIEVPHNIEVKLMCSYDIKELYQQKFKLVLDEDKYIQV